MIRNFLVGILLLLFSGCATHRYNEGAVVRVKNSNGASCNAAVIGKNLIVSVGHCLSTDSVLFVFYRQKWHKATLVQKYEGDHDTIVVMCVPTVDWSMESWFALNPTGMPHLAITRHSGRVYWNSALSYPGDSGSPVIDRHGRLVGLIWGHYLNTNKAIVEFLPKSMLNDSRWPAPGHTCAVCDTTRPCGQTE